MPKPEQSNDFISVEYLRIYYSVNTGETYGNNSSYWGHGLRRYRAC